VAAVVDMVAPGVMVVAVAADMVALVVMALVALVVDTIVGLVVAVAAAEHAGIKSFCYRSGEYSNG
jgi:hypothetical protein